MPRALVYLRVSKREQKLGTGAQEDASRSWAEAKGFDVAGVYTDQGVSSLKSLKRRKGFAALLKDLRAGDTLLVAKRDRIGRHPYLLMTAEQLLKRAKARIASAAGEGTEDDKPTSVLMRRILDAFAEYELAMIRSRTAGTSKYKVKLGERAGAIPYGWRPDPTGPVHEKSGLPMRLIPDDAEQLVRTRIGELAGHGASLRAIAAVLNADAVPTKTRRGPWSKTTVGQILESIKRGER